MSNLSTSSPAMRLAEKLIQGDKTKAALVHFGVNRRYFTQFQSSAGELLITADNAYLIVDFRYFEAAGYKAKDCEVIMMESGKNTLGDLIEKLGLKEIYIEMENLSLGVAKRLEKTFENAGAKAIISDELDKAIMELRIIKTPFEVEKIEAAQKITDETFEHILPFIKEGVTERELALEMEFHMKSLGAEDVAFPSIVVAGKNGSQCHGVPSDNKVQNGDFITMDFGAMLDGFNSDMTRTVAFGEISAEQKKVYDLVLKAHLEVIEKVKPGIPCSDVDKIARDIIEEEYAGKFEHGLGHGVGYEIHEEPRFSKFDTTPCAAGMVVTDEPGIYLAGQFGVRIEDMLLVTEDGCRSLTKSRKDLIIL